MPKGKKGFSSGAENHRYRSTDAGAESAAGDEGAPAKRPRDGDSAAAGHTGQRCALPSCDVLRYNEQVASTPLLVPRSPQQRNVTLSRALY